MPHFHDTSPNRQRFRSGRYSAPSSQLSWWRLTCAADSLTQASPKQGAAGPPDSQAHRPEPWASLVVTMCFMPAAAMEPNQVPVKGPNHLPRPCTISRSMACQYG